jgi:hypothetical protein
VWEDFHSTKLWARAPDLFAERTNPVPGIIKTITGVFSRGNKVAAVAGDQDKHHYCNDYGH